MSAAYSRLGIGLGLFAGLAITAWVVWAPAEREARPNFVVIDIDTLRADRVFMRRDDGPLMPELTALAAGGTRFTTARSNASWTLPALTTILSGRHPPVASDNRDSVAWIAPGDRLLPDILGIYGYTTVAAWGGSFPSHFPPFSMPFGHILPSDVGDPFPPVIEFLLDDPPEPFFLLVHNLDLHAPDGAFTREELHRFLPAGGPCGSLLDLTRLYKEMRDHLGDAVARDHVIGHYDAEVRRLDAWIGDVAAALDDSGLDRRTVLIVTSNHGEELFEHGFMGHGIWHYENVIRVPLIVIDPAAPAPGATVTTPVESIDLAPTILARAGIEPEADMEGASWLSLVGMSDSPYPERDVFAVSTPWDASLQSGNRKLVRYGLDDPNDPVPPPRSGRVPLLSRNELYDVAADPEERHDLAALEPDHLAALSARLDALVAGSVASTRAMANPRLREFLQGHGYWEPAGDPKR